MRPRSPDVEQLIVKNMKPLECIDCDAPTFMVDVLGGRINGWAVTRQLHCNCCDLNWTQVIDRRHIVPGHG